MKFSAFVLSLALLPASVLAATESCESEKYHKYVDASLTWYQNLVQLAVQKDPNLKEVGDWFLEGRTHHFELKREAVDWYLTHDESHLDLSQSIESWLKLTQQDIKSLSEQQGALGDYAKKVFEDRQGAPHPKNYELRSAFAELLTHPDDIDKPLKEYNQQMSAIASTECK
ncbi:hypothetical protein [Photobacterium galatheae]|uniref:Lipoprotein n=1 Tax=Photobacterium galatheae TaxID=1654360 RepID=A0A066RW07_9GAMM|nr:hypothetical protein [Photobacterium galatheae]KDM91563.1 hypothetical protein EA58_11100 [Photobacterium galatheae]MCM0149637.1 hypothetical protein [Photobacterium galatheae]